MSLVYCNIPELVIYLSSFLIFLRSATAFSTVLKFILSGSAALTPASTKCILYISSDPVLVDVESDSLLFSLIFQFSCMSCYKTVFTITVT